MTGSVDLGGEILDGKISRTIVLLSLPLIVSNIFQILYNLVDTYYVGALGPEAIAAVALGFPFIFLIWAVGIGLSVGITSIVSRFLGAGREDLASERASAGIAMALIFTVLLGLLGLVALEVTVRSLDVSGEIKRLTRDYVYILLLGTPFVFLELACSGIIRAEGNMVVPMYALVVGTAVNISLDPVLIHGWYGAPAMGVRGAALATITAQGIVMALLLTYVATGRTRARIRLRHMRARSHDIRQILQVGFPASISHLMIAIGVFLWNALAAGISDETVAAVGLGFRLNSIALLPALGMQLAVTTIVGQNVGAGRFDRVREVVRTSILMTYVYMVTVAIVLNVQPERWIAIFTDDWTVISEGGMFLRIVTPSYIFLATTIVIGGAFQGAGDAVPPMVIHSLRMIAITVPVAWALMYPLGLAANGLWIAIAVSNLAAGAIAWIWFGKGSWERGHAAVLEA